MMGKKVWASAGHKHKQFSCAQFIPNPADVSELEMARLLEGFMRLRTEGIPGVMVTETISPGTKWVTTQRLTGLD